MTRRSISTALTSPSLISLLSEAADVLDLNSVYFVLNHFFKHNNDKLKNPPLIRKMMQYSYEEDFISFKEYLIDSNPASFTNIHNDIHISAIIISHIIHVLTYTSAETDATGMMCRVKYSTDPRYFRRSQRPHSIQPQHF